MESSYVVRKQLQDAVGAKIIGNSGRHIKEVLILILLLIFFFFKSNKVAWTDQ